MVKMGGPYLESGESIVLTTDRVRYNGLQYDMLLTTRHLILVDTGHTRFQPSMYPLLSILSVKGGKTANGEMVISIFFNETPDENETGPMILVFSQQPGEQRKSERDDWIKKLMKLIVSARQETNAKASFPADQKAGIQPSLRRTFAPDMPLPFKTSHDTRPAHVEFEILPDEPEFPVRPGDAEPDGIPVQVEGKETPFDADLVSNSPVDEPPSVNGGEVAPVDAGWVPESSVTLSTSVHNNEANTLDDERVQEDPATLSSSIQNGEATHGEPEEILPNPVTLSSSIHESEESSGDGGQVPESLVTLSPSIPDIEVTKVETERVPGSTVTQTHPLRNREDQPDYAEKVPETPDTTIVPDGIATDTPDRERELEASIIISRTSPNEEIPVVTRKDTGYADLPIPPEQSVTGYSQNFSEEEQELPESTIPETSEVQESFQQTGAGDISSSPKIPPQMPHPGLKKRTFTTVTALLIIILVIVGAGVYYSAYRPSQPVAAGPTSTPTLTQQQTPVPTPVSVPATGIWVRVSYPGDFYGWLGIAGSLRGVNSSGEQVYKLPESAETVQVNMYKPDNSGKPLVVEVYREGKMINNRTVIVPMGSIELLIDAKTGVPPGLSPTVTSSVNQTGSGGRRIMYF